MFIVLLRFSNNKGQAASLMAGHNEWIDQGVADGVFQLVGSLQPAAGGVILAHNTDRAGLEARLKQDPTQLPPLAIVSRLGAEATLELLEYGDQSPAKEWRFRWGAVREQLIHLLHRQGDVALGTESSRHHIVECIGQPILLGLHLITV